MPVHLLSFHGGYACRHSGACCSSNWPIPVEADQAERIRTALARGALRMESGSAPFDRDVRSDLGTVLPIVDGRCAFFDRDGGRLCRVQLVLGHEALPLACRQFPRIVVRDPRGVAVTLSHYCPTAAAMLDDDVLVSISDTPRGFPPDAEYEGLEARDSLPPLLRPGMLMDWESWWECERLAVGLIGNATGPPAGPLLQLHAAIEHLRTWRPSDGPLIERVRRAFAIADAIFANGLPDSARAHLSPARLTRRCLEVIQSIPAGLPAVADHPDLPRIGENLRPADGVTRRFLAAHAFASWTIHLGHGLRTWLRSIDAAYALIEGGRNVRQADLLLRHLCDPSELARTWSEAESEVDPVTSHG